MRHSWRSLAAQRKAASQSPGPATAPASIARSLLALGIFAALAFLYWGIPLVGHFGTRYVGVGTDPLDIFMWSLAWWPHAIAQGLNPLHVTGVWGDSPINLGWTTSIPLPSIVLAPLTLLDGPVVSYNVFALSAPTLTAFTTFLLAMELTDGAYLPSLAAGYFTGFSSYEVGQTQGHPFLTMACLIPLMVLVVVRVWRRFPARVGLGPAVLLAGLLISQFLISTELFTTVTFFGSLFVVIAAVVLRDPPRMRPVLTTIEVGYALALVVLAPVLFTLIGHAPFHISAATRTSYSTDLLSLVVPSALNWVGPLFLSLSRLFSAGNLAEQGGYLGIFLIALVTLAVVRMWKLPWVRIAAYTLMALLIATLGPVLQVAGRPLIPLPWSVFSLYPILAYALPGRFMMYVALLSSILAAAYLAREGRVRPWAWGLAGAALLSLVPIIGAPFTWSAVTVPPFFTSRQIRRRLVRNETVLFLPASHLGDGSFFQAASHFYFRLADGYLAPEVPLPWDGLSVMPALIDGVTPTDAIAQAQLKAMLRLGGVRNVIGPRHPSVHLRTLAHRTGLSYQGTVGGVSIWDVPAHLRVATSSTTWFVLRADRQVYLSEVAMLLRASQTYLRQGRPLARLSASVLAAHRLVPRDFGWRPAWNPTPGWTIWGGWVGAWGAGKVAIMLQGPWNELQPVVARYGAAALQVDFPYPDRLGTSRPSPLTEGVLVLVFGIKNLTAPN
ncbi:MAG: hypothetical protein ACP5QO_05420 [Clostridia bacterium]